MVAKAEAINNEQIPEKVESRHVLKIYQFLNALFHEELLIRRVLIYQICKIETVKLQFTFAELLLFAYFLADYHVLKVHK